jgi:rhodanese-related sulfurtransferase
VVLFSNLLSAQTIIGVDATDFLPYVETYDAKSQVIIDGRTQSMFESGHLENAVNINVFSEEVDEKLSNYLDRERILVYCTKNNRSKTIIEKLGSLGYAGEIVLIAGRHKVCWLIA